jgi:DNA repair protein RadC
MKIMDIPKDERPRERLIKNGPENLSNEELLSIILTTGTKNESVKELSLNILKQFNRISDLKYATINKLIEIKGIGISKATIIMAVIELSRRMNTKVDSDAEILNNPKKIYEYTRYLFNDKKQELFYSLYFNNKQKLVGKKLLFIGTVNKSITHPREVFKYAYLYSATSIICIHNHPSGDVTPSKEDVIFTNALVEIGLIQKIQVLDHIIVSDNCYYSFQDNGKINNR